VSSSFFRVGPAVLAVAAAAVVSGLGDRAVLAWADTGVDVSVTAAPTWGDVSAGSWTPYTVTLHNAGGVDVEGEVVLVARPDPPPKPGAPPPTTSPPTPSPPTTAAVVAIGGRAVTSPRPATQPVSPERPVWPTYRSEVSLPAGSDKTLTVMVLEAPFGYGVELHDRAGRRVATGPGPVGPPKPHTALLLLSNVVGADATLRALPQQVAPNLDLVQVPARDFPTAALDLAGVDIVAIDGFDPATLSAGQVRALQDYVSLGGSLLLGGGAAGSNTLKSLPGGVVPLVPSGTTTTSLGPLVELAAQITTASATVLTGEITSGRVMVAALGGPPLVVESDYGSGRVVELAYDPLAEPFASDVFLRGLAFDQGLSRATPTQFAGFYTLSAIPSAASASEDQVWGATLTKAPWPEWPRWTLGLLVFYALLAGPAGFVLSRRTRPAAALVLLPVLTILTAATCLTAATAPTPPRQRSR